MLQQRCCFCSDMLFCFAFRFIQMEETYCLQLVIQSVLRGSTVCGGLWKQKLLEHPSLPSNGLSHCCIPSGDKALSLSLTSQFAGGFLGRHGGGHVLRWESLLNWACVSSCASTFWSLICVCLLAWGKNARTLEKPWIFGVGVVLFVFLVVQKCPNALVGIYSQNRSWF